MIELFHTDMDGTVQFNGSSSEPFDIRSSVKQGCVLGAMLFGGFLCSAVGKFLPFTPQQKGSACAPDQMPASELRQMYPRIRDMLFADDAAIATHTKQELLSPMGRFSHACKDPYQAGTPVTDGPLLPGV